MGPFLCIGVSLAIFSSDGNCPSIKLWFIIFVSGITICGMICFSRWFDMLSNPADFFDLNALTSSVISDSLVFFEREGVMMTLALFKVVLEVISWGFDCAG